MSDTHATTTQILDHLRQAYAERRLLPRADGRHVFPCEELKTGRCVCTQDARLGLWLLRRLYRHVMTEGYGQ